MRSNTARPLSSQTMPSPSFSVGGSRGRAEVSLISAFARDLAGQPYGMLYEARVASAGLDAARAGSSQPVSPKASLLEKVVSLRLGGCPEREKSAIGYLARPL